jgi:hypothetical protein
MMNNTTKFAEMVGWDRIHQKFFYKEADLQKVLRNEEVEGPVEKKKESLLNDKFSSTSGLIL